METKIKSASVKVMNSYNYSHFETSMTLENDNGVTLKDINDARKNCQRLVDNAIQQYQTAKDFAAKRNDGKYQMENFKSQCEKIKIKQQNDRTINEIAMLKQYETEDWEKQFAYEYDYDDESYNF